MKKLALLLAVLMIMSAMLVACSKKNKDDDIEDDNKTKDPTIVDGETTDDENGSEDGTEDGTEKETDGYIEPTSFTFTECEEKTIYATTIINIRKEASFANSVEKKSVVEGTALIKIAESNETAKDSDGYDYKWFKVRYEDAEWCVKSTLTTTVENPDDGFVAVEKTLYLNTNGLSVRQFPNTENNPVAYLSMGEEIKVIAENTESGWYKISYDGKYVKGEFYIVSDAKYFSETPVSTESGAEG